MLVFYANSLTGTSLPWLILFSCTWYSNVIPAETFAFETQSGATLLHCVKPNLRSRWQWGSDGAGWPVFGMCAFYIIEPFQRWATSKISTTMFHVFLSFTALLTFVEGAFQFNSSTFYLNTTCTLNIPVAAITVVGSPNDTVYQIFGTQEFVIHKLRGDLHMVRKPKDQDPLFYISASSWNGSVATAVVEVHHNCPTVSFDAVSYHFFALRRAPLSVIGNLKVRVERRPPDILSW